MTSTLHMSQKRDIQRGGPKKEFDDQIRDLGLPKDDAENLASTMDEK